MDRREALKAGVAGLIIAPTVAKATPDQGVSHPATDTATFTYHPSGKKAQARQPTPDEVERDNLAEQLNNLCSSQDAKDFDNATTEKEIDVILNKFRINGEKIIHNSKVPFDIKSVFSNYWEDYLKCAKNLKLAALKAGNKFSISER